MHVVNGILSRDFLTQFFVEVQLSYMVNRVLGLVLIFSIGDFGDLPFVLLLSYATTRC